MVYYFTSTAVDPPAQIYVGKDSSENEGLIAHGWAEDVCAHVYIRLAEGQSWESIAKDLLYDCAQLTKANSIEGNKKDNITVIYTPWSNLRKDGSMKTGQVGFKNNGLVKKVFVPQRENPIVNRLNKTRVEKFPDLRQEKADREAELRKRDQAETRKKQKEELEIARERAQLRYQKEHMYDDLHGEDAVEASCNQDRDPDFLDDFM